jgi:hypothetical protein
MRCYPARALDVFEFRGFDPNSLTQNKTTLSIRHFSFLYAAVGAAAQERTCSLL